MGVHALSDRVAALATLDPIARILRVPGQALHDRERVELAEGQAKRSGDSEVSLEVLRSRSEIDSFGSGPRPVLRRNTRE